MDSNVIFAYLDKDHDFNYEARVIIEPLKEKECWFFIHYIAMGEFINKWATLKKVSIKETIDILIKFINSFKHSFNGGTPLTRDIIFNSFKRHARHKNFLKAHFNDFIVLTEAEDIKNIKIVTCDKYMYEAGKNIFKKNIYYLPFKTKKGKSDLSRFVKDMENLI